MKLNINNKMPILDCWITQQNDTVYKLWVNPAYVKNVICVGIYTNNITPKQVKDDILLGYDATYEYKDI